MRVERSISTKTSVQLVSRRSQLMRRSVKLTGCLVAIILQLEVLIL